MDEEIDPEFYPIGRHGCRTTHWIPLFYRIGQRKGLGIALGKPMFVIQILPESNSVVLGEEHELEEKPRDGEKC